MMYFSVPFQHPNIFLFGSNAINASSMDLHSCNVNTIWSLFSMTKDALALRLKELGKDYICGIVVFENGVWNYNGSTNYKYQKGKMSQDKNWLPFEALF